jgi:hypothetical protein
VAVRAILDPLDAVLPDGVPLEAARRRFARLAPPAARAELSRLAALIAGRRAARRALETFFAEFCAAGAGLVALERGTEGGATRPA